MKSTSTLLRLLPLWAVVVLAMGCQKGLGDLEPLHTAEITFELDIPVSQQVVSRAFEDESAVRTLDILFFEASGANSAAPLYKERRHLDYVITVELGKVRAVVKDLPLGQYRVLVVGNAPSDMFDGLTTATTLEGAKTLLVTKNDPTMPESNLLMAGESTKVESITDGAQVLSTISLVRAVARIDVRCGLKNIAKAPFELTSAEVRNVRDQSYVFGQSLLTEKDKVAYPATAALVDYVRPDVTSSHPTYADAMGNIDSQLYIYENSSADNTLNKDGTSCLIVGGKFNGSQITTYYRIDLSNTNGKFVIKRNHQYIVSITTVLGPGYATKDEAEQGMMNNLKAEILDWVEGGSSGMMIEGDKMISVSRTLFNVDLYSTDEVLDLEVWVKNMATNKFKIEQDGPSTEWLRIDKSAPFTSSGDNEYETKIQLKIIQDNPSPDARTATLKISAGGAMYLLVKVVQGNTDRIMITYTLPELVSYAYVGHRVDFAFNDANQNQPTTGLKWRVESMDSWIKINTTDHHRDSGQGADSLFIDVEAHPALGSSRRGHVRLTIEESGKYYYRSIPIVQYNTPVSVDLVEIDGSVQRSLKVPDAGFNGEYIMRVRSRGAITLQLDDFSQEWSADWRYNSNGIYDLAITASPVADRRTATERTSDTYRVGYINFLNVKGKILRTMLVYQGYVKALPNTIYIHERQNYASLTDPSIPTGIMGAAKGLRPQNPTVPLTYELIAYGKRVWLDRNVNAELPCIQDYSGASPPFPPEYDTENKKNLGTLGSAFHVITHPLYQDIDNNQADQQKRLRGACPPGFRLPMKADIEALGGKFATYPYLDDDRNTLHPWVRSNSIGNFVGFAPKLPGQTQSYLAINATKSAVTMESYAIDYGLQRCISEK